MRRFNRRSPWLVALFLFAVMSLVAGACSDSDSASMQLAGGEFTQTTTVPEATTTTAAGSFAQRYSDTGDDLALSGTLNATVSSGDLGTDGIAAPVVFQTPDFGRDIIFTAEISVAVTDVAVAGDRATREISALGGFLFGQRTTGAPNPVSVLTFKVLPEDFTDALDKLGEIGEIRSQNVSASDVTDRIVDLESRILTAEASVERLRELLASAGGVAVVVQVETELLQRETQLETLRGQLRTLEDQVGLATIVVTLSEAATQPSVDLMVTAYAGFDGLGQGCPGDFGLGIEQNTEATVCFEIFNTGDTPLINVELNDPVLDITLEDLTVVSGEPAEQLEPGESLIFAFEITPERDLRTQTRVSATPLNQDGDPQEGRAVANTTSILIDAVDPGGIAGFSEGLDASLSFLANLGRLLILGAGVLLPFIWLLPILAWAVIKWRRREIVIAPEYDEVPSPS
ncbi:MAG: DUF4349 domain-containing protein [Acidimicrobiia bacterium]|nr:DUF4349 domain-containing protein [Acidimicrobiia bacterium]